MIKSIISCFLQKTGVRNMQYIKPNIISYTDEELQNSIIAYASCGATYCAIGTQWGNTCGSAATYCPFNAYYDSGSIVTCPSGANYTGPWSQPPIKD